jgi:putative hydrolase of the HAD superfamily
MTTKITKIRGIGFDLGDTLIYYRDTPLNWVALYPDALRLVAAACELSPTPEQMAAAAQALTGYNTRMTPRTHETTAEEILSRVLRSWGLNNATHLPAAIEAFFIFFQQKISTYPETVQVLSSLHARGFPTGILTDVPYGMPRHFVQRDLDRAGISDLFDVLLTSVEVGVRKPEPDGYLALATRLSVAPDEMLYVGNEPKDVIGARRAGVTAVFLDRTGDGGNHGQQFTISTMSGLSDLISNGSNCANATIS